MKNRKLIVVIKRHGPRICRIRILNMKPYFKTKFSLGQQKVVTKKGYSHSKTYMWRHLLSYYK